MQQHPKRTTKRRQEPIKGMIPAFQVEHEDGRTYLITCEQPMTLAAVEAAESNLNKQPGVRRVRLIGLYDDAIKYTFRELTEPGLFTATRGGRR